MSFFIDFVMQKIPDIHHFMQAILVFGSPKIGEFFRSRNFEIFYTWGEKFEISVSDLNERDSRWISHFLNDLRFQCILDNLSILYWIYYPVIYIFCSYIPLFSISMLIGQFLQMHFICIHMRRCCQVHKSQISDPCW